MTSPLVVGVDCSTTSTKAIVVDAGPEPPALDRCLAALDVRRVPLLVLTHFHSDHVGGLAALAGREVDAVLAPAGHAGADFNAVREDLDGTQFGQVPKRGGAFGDGHAGGPLHHEIGAACQQPAAHFFIGLQAQGVLQGLGKADVDFFGDFHGGALVISVGGRGAGRRPASRRR